MNVYARKCVVRVNSWRGRRQTAGWGWSSRSVATELGVEGQSASPVARLSCSMTPLQGMVHWARPPRKAMGLATSASQWAVSGKQWPWRVRCGGES